MNSRHAAALALVGWYLLSPTVAGCVESDDGNKWPLIMPPITKTEQGTKTDLEAPLYSWWTARKYPSREACERDRAIWPSDSATRQQVLNAKCVYVDDLVTWCLGVALGKEVPKGCSNCAVTLELVGLGCVKEFKKKGECTLAADEYIQDYYVKADKRGDLVIFPPDVACSQLGPPPGK